MVIRFLNASDLIGCGGDPQPMRFILGGQRILQRGAWRGACRVLQRGA